MINMENSFFEYRNESVNSDSDGIIDNSVIDESFTYHKKITQSAKKNQTVFVAESASEDDTESYEETHRTPVDVVRKSGLTVDNSDSDSSKRSSIRRQSQNSSTKVVLSSSSDEGEVSPEIVPRRRPPLRQKSNNSSADSPLIRRIKRRMILTDSETDNSIIIDNDKHNKMTCLKETPAKLEAGKTKTKLIKPDVPKMDNSDDEVNVSSGDIYKISSSDNDKVSGSDNDKVSGSDNEKVSGDNDKVSGSDNELSKNSYNNHHVSDESDGPDEDEMVMSRATRMSIMGFVPKDQDSDSSDFIETDESNIKSKQSIGSLTSLNDLPDVGMESTNDNVSPKHTATSPKTPEKTEINEDLDDSKISCSTFGSPIHDVSKEFDNSNNRTVSKNFNSSNNITASIDLTMDVPYVEKYVEVKTKDDDVTIIDHQPEVIALSSDDDEPTPHSTTKSPSKKSPVKKNIKQYLIPDSYPNQGVVYVKKHVRENELNKLNQLREDLHNVRYLLEQMDVDTLPDGGAKLFQRLTNLESDVNKQAERLAKMVVEPDAPPSDKMSKEANFPPSWEDLQMASDKVQPRMFGKQAMSTHMAERNLILDRLRSLHSSLASRPSESSLASQPRGLMTQLMQHQRHALAWLVWRETQRPRAGILADDMGLGKTLTMIALIVSSKEANLDEEDDESDDEDDGWNGKENSKLVRGGTLVVCPASLLQQWSGEVTRHCRASAVTTLVHHGAARAKNARELGKTDLVITTYNLLQRDKETGGPLLRVRWRRVVLDEAHVVRNHKSSTCGAVTAATARRRWALTGTPVQNKDLDIFALMRFLRLTPFHELPMWKKWIDNKSQGGQERLCTIMSCLVLRRTKVQLQQKGLLECLPDRHEENVVVKLTDEEMNVYHKVLVFSKTLFAQFLHQKAEKQQDLSNGFLPKPEKDDAYAKMHKKMVKLQGAKPVKSHEILVLLLRLRQVCCHCGLLAGQLVTSDLASGDDGSLDMMRELSRLTLEDKKNGNKEDEKEEEDEIPEESLSVSEAIQSVVSANNPVFKLNRMSSKIGAVMKCLKENVFVNKGEKAVVVSQWTSVLRLVEQELKNMRVETRTLSGQVPVPARAKIVDDLNNPHSGVKVLLLSLCAGGVGLNLCGANHLFLLDPHWNPQLEQQAQDRIYRVGQTKVVTIYRFMCVGTVEESIRKLQAAKLELAENVLTGAKHVASKLSIDDLKMLFNMN